MTRQLDVLAPHSEPHLPLVFFDGGCPLCRREIAHYQSIDTAQRLCWVDVVSEPEALERHGLSLEVALSLIHISEPTRRRDSSRMPSSA